jgi:acyl-CoA synthetase (AMP-forming)/AMP-acid ligase II
MKDGGPIAADGHATLVALLRAQARQIGKKRVAIFLGEEGFDGPALDREGLDLRARALAVRLEREGLRPGDRALLIYPPGLDFLVGFFGCLYAGVTAVPVCPPAPPLERTMPRLGAIAERSAPGAVLSDAATIDLLRAHLGKYAWAPGPERWIGSDETPAELAEAWRDPEARPETPAFLQFTSGSTAAPKGVVVTHQNIVSNQRMIQEIFRLPEKAVFASWLPLFHDMGLVGNLMQPIWLGGELVLLSPSTFLARPRRWLEAITHFRAQASAAPNFAFELCVRRIPLIDREGLDLSSWERAMCGAERVRPETLDAFVRAFGPHGFKEKAFAPCYGLAEATLLVSGRHDAARARRLRVDRSALEDGRLAGAEGPRATEIVSCGATPTALDVRIVEPSSRRACAEGRIGEVWVRGASIASGYYEAAEASRATFGGRLPDGTGPFLRTGDLGFIDRGELFICGRIKDLIIIRGRNFAPEDIEALVSRAHHAVRPGGVAAFSLDAGGEERLALVVEVREPVAPRGLDPGDDVVGSIREEIARVFRLSPHVVALAPAGSIPKTSSGKIQRSACRTAYLSGSFDIFSQREAKEIA